MKIRYNTILDPFCKFSLTSSDMEKLVKIIENLYSDSMDTEIPFKLTSDYEENIKASLDTVKYTTGGTLLPKPQRMRRGDKILGVEIQKIGLKDAPKYFDPFITFSFMDCDNNIISGLPKDSASQNTGTSNRREGKHIIFNSKAYLHVPYNRFINDHEKEDIYLVFEFKHYKPSKDKISTRCWTFITLKEMEQNNLGDITLELYAKPTNLKKIRLFTAKKLYLKLKFTLDTV